MTESQFDWDEVWNRKGNSASLDHVEISGFENTVLDSQAAANGLIKLLDLKPDDTVLEVGCGGGVLARHLSCKYVGCDRSEPMVKKTIILNGFSAVVCDADNLIFRDKSFDKVFAFGVFHYFPDYEYARRVLVEMERVARSLIFVADLPRSSHDSNHLLYQDDFFSGWQISPGFYTDKRFNALKLL